MSKIRERAGVPPPGQVFCTKCRSFKPEQNFLWLVAKNNYSSWCRDCVNENNYQQGSHYQRLYGLSKEGFESLLASQRGLCGVCGKKLKFYPQAPCVDHDHITGKVRGILCRPCNTLVGNDSSVIWNALVYLKKHGESRAA